MEIITTKRLIFTKMFVWLVVVTFIPLCILAFAGYRYSINIIKKEAHHHINVLSQRQTNAIENYITKKIKVADIFVSTRRIVDFINAVNEGKFSKESELGTSLRKTGESLLAHLVNSFEFDDLMIIGYPSEKIYYSYKKYPEFEMPIYNQIFESSQFREMIQDSIRHMSVQVASIDLYKPTEQFGIFIAEPIVIDKSLRGILVLQLKNDHFLEIVNDLTGLGTTGETLIVTSTQRHPMFINKTRHAIDKLHKSLDSSAPFISYELANSALEKPNDFKIYEDYRKEPVIAAWSLSPKMQWSILVKKDISEVVGVVQKISYYSLCIMASILCLVILSSVSMSASLYAPMAFLTARITRLLNKNFKMDLDITSEDKNSIVNKAFNALLSEIRDLIFLLKAQGQDLKYCLGEILLKIQEEEESVTFSRQKLKEIVYKNGQALHSTHSLIGMINRINANAHKTTKETFKSLGFIKEIYKINHKAELNQTFITKQLKSIQQMGATLSSKLSELSPIADQMNLISINASIEMRKFEKSNAGLKVIVEKMSEASKGATNLITEINHYVLESEKIFETAIQHLAITTSQSRYHTNHIGKIAQSMNQIITEHSDLPSRLENMNKELQTQNECIREIGSLSVLISNDLNNLNFALKGEDKKVRVALDQCDRLSEKSNQFNL